MKTHVNEAIPKPSNVKPRWRKYLVEALILFFGLVVMNLIFIAKAFRQSDTIDAPSAGLLGDFVGGYIGTSFALISVILIYATFKNQRQANQQQNFETKYFELIKMHRDNVAELELQRAKGRKIFVLLLRELRSILVVTRRIAEEQKQSLTSLELMHVAYYCLFFGVGPNSSRMLKMSLSEFNISFIETLEAELNTTSLKESTCKDKKLGYVPFEGHQSRLGHYYRHLYQTVCYVDGQSIDINKYEYVKTIRAQLSTHEQALLLLNSLTPIGKNWRRKNLIQTYRMVQNLPKDFFDNATELDLSKLFDSNYFEWEEN